MLIHLSVNNFAIVQQLNLHLSAGMSVITGETGAGKSIAIDALGLCLGERSDTSMIRHQQEKADISATFQLDHLPQAIEWLQQYELIDDEIPNQCILRRVIRHDGRSKAFINNYPIPTTQLREFGTLLVQINGQHCAQSLLKSDNQLTILDQYAKNNTLLKQLESEYKQWRQCKRALDEFQHYLQENNAKKQLLQYQVNELNEFNPKQDEYESLEQQQRCLANSERMTQLSQAIANLLNENDAINIESMLNKASAYCEELSELSPQYENINQYLQDALIQVQEAASDLSGLIAGIEQDPMLLQEVEQRLTQYHQLAKKHYIAPTALYQKHIELQQDLAQLGDPEENEASLQQALQQAEHALTVTTATLYQQRQKAAEELSEEVNALLKDLAMENAIFSIDIHHQTSHYSAKGADNVTFLLQSNLGQNAQPLAKIASGGELSRISLALQVLSADQLATPTLIFDEVDTGISGATASVVGRLLKQLSLKCQVLCVTHLPQVAVYGQHHFSVSKFTQNGETMTEMTHLKGNARIQAVSRLLSGSEITETTLANAKELLEKAV